MQIKRTPQFKRDFKKCQKKHYDMSKLYKALECLINRDIQLLKTKYRDHSLSGDKKGYRELHIEGDWLLVYYFENEHLVLVLARTGTHDEVL